MLASLPGALSSSCWKCPTAALTATLQALLEARESVRLRGRIYRALVSHPFIGLMSKRQTLKHFSFFSVTRETSAHTLLHIHGVLQGSMPYLD